MSVMNLCKSDNSPITPFLTLKSCEKIMLQQSHIVIVKKKNCIKKNAIGLKELDNHNCQVDN